MAQHKLIIAEKPSMAQSIAAALHIRDRRNGYLEGNGYLVSWCYGHLAELADAAAYDSRYAKWEQAHLPIIPDPFRFTLRKDCRKQYDLLRELMHRTDVTEIINACDAGREGEFIFRTVYQLAGCTKPILRLWISSMEDDSIRAGFENLRPGQDYDGLYQAALCRAKADWLVGINATRFFSLLYGPTLHIGRVVSPTLALVVQRETEINTFRSEPFYTVHLDCGIPFSSERLQGNQQAADIAAACTGQTLTVTRIEQKEGAEKAPPLFDLTTLQREANRQLGYTAQQTLDYLQALYEKKLCTYPRTDSKYLTDDMTATVPALVNLAASICSKPVPEIHTSQVCCSKQVTDHHAIIPTAKASETDLQALPAGEREVLKLVATRLLCAVGSPHRILTTEISAECCGHTFSAKSQTILDMGWKSCLAEQQERPAELPPVSEGDQLHVRTATVKDGKTTPPKHYTEGTLLAAMEAGGKADLPEDAERKGIGTPATRAGILEKLVSTGMIQRKRAQKSTHLIPTALGISLITVLPEQLQSPQLTAEWERRLKEVEHRELSPEAFMQGITQMLQEILTTYTPRPNANILFPNNHNRAGRCPLCQSFVAENTKGFFCENKSCYFAIWKNSRFFSAKKIPLTHAIALALIEKGEVWLDNCYSEKTGRRYSGLVVLTDDGKQIGFKMDFGKKNTNE